MKWFEHFNFDILKWDLCLSSTMTNLKVLHRKKILRHSTSHPSARWGVIERWELIQAQKYPDVSDIKEGLEQWQKLNSDLCDVTSWLGRVLPELERLQRIAPSTSIRDTEVNIKKLKVSMLKLL